ncbi:E3 ubiquitin-protein ligase Midline-1-like [Xyrauchen texanus]|uniref:E3 ubiquitin-protein ligase Midline-1-like n=1 Tax=Xyrauchen texanus TaxID=154827 RepID=UPI00224269FD|nr:E3 ubiquitin-protein ligase Midline-1-like [Xyrauchen texanus]
MAKSLELLNLGERWLENLLKCPVCDNFYDEPRQLPCGHNFCRQCLSVYYFIPLEQSHYMHCPECSMMFILTKDPTEHKCFTLCSIVEDFRKSIQDAGAAVIYCCICHTEGAIKEAVTTCLMCEVSLCDEHVHQHREVFQEHLLVEPPMDLSEMKCMNHTNLVLKYNSPLSNTSTCNTCALERKWMDQIKENLSYLGERFEIYIKSHHRGLEKIVDNSHNVLKSQTVFLRENTVPNQKTEDVYFGAVALILLLSCFCVLSTYIENNKIRSTVLTQSTQLQELFHYLSDAECFDPSTSSSTNKVHSPSTQLMNFLTLDLDSSSPFLKVSPDLMSVERVDHKLPLPSHPSRFRETPQILTHQCFSYGRHYWEVIPEGVWDVAVSYKSIKRNVKDFFGYNKNSWSLTRKFNGSLVVYHNRTQTMVSRSLDYQKVAIAIDFQEGSITFSEVGKQINLLHKFRSQLTQPVCLGFGLYKTYPPSRITIVKKIPFPMAV